ncbi:MAG: hypothetical protein VYD54_08975 [Bdellovibrionota bacterium]|nr:hypothetical protein [Bdellovibrionota bacterium]
MAEDSNEDIIRDNMKKIVMSRIGGEIEVEFEELAEFNVTKPESQRLMSVIFIQNNAVTFNLQISYSVEDAIYFSNFQGVEEKSEEELKLMAKDFINELCNMAGGGIKHIIEEDGLDALISLPIATRTEDANLFRAHPKGNSHIITDQWMLESGDHSILCYTKMEVFDEESLIEKIVPAFGGGEDAGGGVFFL